MHKEKLFRWSWYMHSLLNTNALSIYSIHWQYYMFGIISLICDIITVSNRTSKLQTCLTTDKCQSVNNWKKKKTTLITADLCLKINSYFLFALIGTILIITKKKDQQKLGETSSLIQLYKSSLT